jgi:hypothetical protein
MIKTFCCALLFFILPEIFRGLHPFLRKNTRINSGLGQTNFRYFFFFLHFFNLPAFPQSTLFSYWPPYTMKQKLFIFGLFARYVFCLKYTGNY